MNNSVTEYAKKACDAVMSAYEPQNLPPVGKFHYHQGVFLSGMEQTYLLTGEKKYFNYIKAWTDSIIDESGTVTSYNSTKLDDKRAATLLFRLLEETGDKRYEMALHMFRESFRSYPCNDEGGFGHSFDRCNEMWLDGLYMASPLLVMYGAKFHDEVCFDLAFRQAELMWKHNRDKKTGLMYHAWDSSKKREWADKETGCAPEVWGRAMGWYIVALNEILEYLPQNYKYRDILIGYVREYISAIVNYQDKKSGLWYQVIDKGDNKCNWLESSATALFTCGIAQAVKKGYVGNEYVPVITKAYEGLINTITYDQNGNLILPNICIGTGVGDFDFYMQRPTVKNDLHGMGAFILASNACSGLI